MNRDFSQAASRAAAIDAVRHNAARHDGKRAEDYWGRLRACASLNVRARNNYDQATGQA